VYPEFTVLGCPTPHKGGRERERATSGPTYHQTRMYIQHAATGTLLLLGYYCTIKLCKERYKLPIAGHKPLSHAIAQQSM
jgi:hypothetical protein